MLTLPLSCLCLINSYKDLLGVLFAPCSLWPDLSLNFRVKDTAGQSPSYLWCCLCVCGPSSSLRCVSTGPTTRCSRPCPPTWTTSCTLTSSRWVPAPSLSLPFVHVHQLLWSSDVPTLLRIPAERLPVRAAVPRRLFSRQRVWFRRWLRHCAQTVQPHQHEENLHSRRWGGLLLRTILGQAGSLSCQAPSEINTLHYIRKIDNNLHAFQKKKKTLSWIEILDKDYLL